VRFADLADGVRAAYIKFVRIQNGRSTTYPLEMSLARMGEVYTGGDNAEAWSMNVAAFLGIGVTNTLREVLCPTVEQSTEEGAGVVD
jgi:hypothetical protein